MQQTVTVCRDAPAIMRAGLELKRRSLSLSLCHYSDRLRDLEARYNMSSDRFAVAFESGELGDEAAWFEWEFVLDAYREATRQLDLLHGFQR